MTSQRPPSPSSCLRRRTSAAFSIFSS